jgi:hypothetical protein
MHLVGFVIRIRCLVVAATWLWTRRPRSCIPIGQGHQISVLQLFRTTYGAETSHLIGFRGCLLWVIQLDTETYLSPNTYCWWE